MTDPMRVAQRQVDNRQMGQMTEKKGISLYPVHLLRRLNSLEDLRDLLIVCMVVAVYQSRCRTPTNSQRCPKREGSMSSSPSRQTSLKPQPHVKFALL